MKVKIPEYIIDNIDHIINIQIYIKKNFIFQLSQDQIKKSQYFFLHESLALKANEIVYYIFTFSGFTSITQSNINNATNILKDFHKDFKFKRGNIVDNDQSRYEFLKNNISKLIENTKQISNVKITSDKTLIYFSIYGEQYANLFIKFNHLYRNYNNLDLLIITDVDTSTYINQNVDYPLTTYITPHANGVEASINKLKIFEYPKITDYKKVIFLDTDIIPIKKLDDFLNTHIKPDILYTITPKNITFYHHKNFYHGFNFLSEDFLNEYFDKNMLPFNAGQFMFVPTNQMLQHFKNVVYFYENWTGDYFFEQSFMNHYFCRTKILDTRKLETFITITNIENKNPTIITDDTCLIHFSGNPLDANFKLNFIEKFLTSEIKNNE